MLTQKIISKASSITIRLFHNSFILEEDAFSASSSNCSPGNEVALAILLSCLLVSNFLGSCQHGGVSLRRYFH